MTQFGTLPAMSHSERKISYYIILGQVAPELEDLADVEPPVGGLDYLWIAAFCVIIMIVIIGVYFKRKLMG